MNKISVYFLTILFSVVHAECPEMNLNECNNNQDCEWIEDLSYGSCGNLSVSQCYDYPGECYVDSLPGWYDSSGPYCTGGTYQIDNSYCQEIQMPECSEMLEGQCDDNEDCEWVEDMQWGNCSNLFYEDCNSISDCTWEYGCLQWGWWYDWCYEYGYECTGGTYQVDNGYCEEVQMPDCSEMNESQCSSDDSCEWIENIEIGDCSDITNSSECYQTNQCSWYNAGNYGYWYDNCYGGTYEIDNSYCEEVSVEYLMGDINNDFIINILDVIVIINLILDGEELAIADMNYDHSVNILDIIILVDIILN